MDDIFIQIVFYVLTLFIACDHISVLDVRATYICM